MNQTLAIKYRTRKDYCPCCEQKLPNAKIGGVKEFTISKENAMSWSDWRQIAEFEEDLQELIREFVYETISFFAVDSLEKIIIENSEFDKAKEFILNVVID